MVFILYLRLVCQLYICKVSFSRSVKLALMKSGNDQEQEKRHVVGMSAEADLRVRNDRKLGAPEYELVLFAPISSVTFLIFSS